MACFGAFWSMDYSRVSLQEKPTEGLTSLLLAWRGEHPLATGFIDLCSLAYRI